MQSGRGLSTMNASDYATRFRSRVIVQASAQRCVTCVPKDPRPHFSTFFALQLIDGYEFRTGDAAAAVAEDAFGGPAL